MNAKPSQDRSARASRRRLRDYAAELITIFAGIVLALFADAAWDYRVERTLEREYLVGLRAELAESARELSRDTLVRRDQLDRVAALLDAAHGDGALPDDSVPLAMNALLNYRFFSPARAVLDDLIDSGNLGIIRSDSLRFELQTYLKGLEQLDVVERRERDFVAEVIEPYIAGALPLNDILPVQSYDDPIVGAPADVQAFRDMLRDEEFANVVFMRFERSIVAFNFGTRIGRSIAGLERLVAREIEGR